MQELKLQSGVAYGGTEVSKNLWDPATFLANILADPYTITQRMSLDGRANVLKVKASTISTTTPIFVGCVFLPATQYRLTADIKPTSTTAWSAGAVFKYTDGTTSTALLGAYTQGGQWQKSSQVSTAGKTVASIIVCSANGQADTYAAYIDLDTIQLEVGTAATGLVPCARPDPTPDRPAELRSSIKAGAYWYRKGGEIWTVTLPEMRGIGAVKDTWDEATGKLTQRVGIEVFDGTEPLSWRLNTDTAYSSTYVPKSFFPNMPTSNYSLPFLCTHAPYINAAYADAVAYVSRTGSWLGGYPDASAAFILTTPVAITGATAAALKAWITAEYAAGRPVTMLYQLATPVVTTIAPTLLVDDRITDRTAADVDRIKALKAKINASGWASLTQAEKDTWAAGRGFYNATDLNRVGAAVAYLADVLHTYGYAVAVNPVTTWKHGDETVAPDELRQAQAATYLADIQALKAAYYGTTPLPSSMNNLDTTQANRIELLLLEIEDNLRRTAAGFASCGTFYMGEACVI